MFLIEIFKTSPWNRNCDAVVTFKKYNYWVHYEFKKISFKFFQISIQKS